MRVARIINEFMDYRAYVSHTLCKHRLFLGLDTPDSARRRLNDASVWPLVGNEALRLLELSDSLFGLVSKALNEQVKAPLHKVLTSLDTLNPHVLAGRDNAFSEFRLSAEKLRDLLTSIADIIREHPPGFSEEAVRHYLDGRTRKDCIVQFVKTIDEQLKPLVAAVVKSEHDVNDHYKQFWPACSDICLLYRTAIVAGAAEGLPAADDGPIRGAYRELQRVERVVSCWSPSIDADRRVTDLRNALGAEGLSTKDSVLDILSRIGGRL